MAQTPELAAASAWLRREREFAMYGDVDVIPTETSGPADDALPVTPSGSPWRWRASSTKSGDRRAAPGQPPDAGLRR